MEIVELRLEDLTPYEKNAKLHPESQVKQIEESIKRFGMNDPIGVWGGEILSSRAMEDIWPARLSESRKSHA